jgi:hypothetical protein
MLLSARAKALWHDRRGDYSTHKMHAACHPSVCTPHAVVCRVDVGSGFRPAALLTPPLTKCRL